MTPIRVILVEPAALSLRSAVRDLENEPRIEVLGTASTAHEALEQIQETLPDVVVVVTPAAGLEILDAVGDSVPLILMSAEESKEAIFEAMITGARGYLLKWYTDVSLREAIIRVATGEIVMGAPSLRLFVTAVKERMRAPKPVLEPSLLTRREREILNLISKGHGQERIAKMLSLSPTTIRTHCRNAYIKLGVRNQVAAVREALRRGLIDGDFSPFAEPQTSSEDLDAPELSS